MPHKQNHRTTLKPKRTKRATVNCPELAPAWPGRQRLHRRDRKLPLLLYHARISAQPEDCTLLGWISAACKGDQRTVHAPHAPSLSGTRLSFPDFWLHTHLLPLKSFPLPLTIPPPHPTPGEGVFRAGALPSLGLGWETLSCASILSSIYSYTLLFCSLNCLVNFLKIQSFVKATPTDNNTITTTEAKLPTCFQQM